jgi:peptide/bleomycin uptake transporter
MFKSFFPNPKLFFLSVLLFSGVACAIWYGLNQQMADLVGLDISNTDPVIGLGHFVTNSFLLFYGFYFICTAVFALFWFKFSPHKWQFWSIIGSSAILFSTYFSVQVSVAINNWRRPFFDLIQDLLKSTDLTAAEKVVTDEELASASSQLFDLLFIFAEIAFLAIFIYVGTRFLVSHYVFRWRSAMNEYYTKHWKELRKVEGASQRIQEDTMRFATIMENLGVALVEAVMTLFAFLPVLWILSEYVSELPVVGEIAHPLFYAALFWSIFGTGLLALVGINLPGLEFNNQKVEAAFRKELVYGEDDDNRAQPIKVTELFDNVRTNYFRLYFHYMYFNVARSLYLQADNIFVFILLVPTIAVGAITFGLLQQILTAFNQVSNSFQYLVNSWPTIVELLSVYKRLTAFESTLDEPPKANTVEKAELTS